MKTDMHIAGQDDLHIYFRTRRPTLVIHDMKIYIHNAAHEDLHR